MATKILVLADSGGDREDGTVDYSSYALVSSDTLNFDEPVFTANVVDDALLKTTEGATGESQESQKHADDANSDEEEGYVHADRVIRHLRALGYTVKKPGTCIVWMSNGDW